MGQVLSKRRDSDYLLKEVSCVMIYNWDATEFSGGW